MKRTLFLAYILAALLACSAAPQAYGYDEDADDEYTLTDRSPLDPWDIDSDEGTNILDVYEDAWDEWDDSRGFYVSMGNPIYVDSLHGYITNGGVTGPIYIYAGKKLTFYSTGYLMFESDDIDLADLKDDDVLSITMFDQSTLNYGNADLLLGPFRFPFVSTHSTVNLYCKDLIARSVDNSAKDFTISAKINMLNDASRLLIPGDIKSVYLDCEQNLNLQTWNYHTYIGKDGQFYGTSSGTKLNGAAINLPDGKTSNIDGYLGGTSTITLGNGTILQGLRQYWPDAEQTGISWLLNDIHVREGSSATMQTGYYGGIIHMLYGSSLKFDMDVISPYYDYDDRKWVGGADFIMWSNNTLDLSGRTLDAYLYVHGKVGENDTNTVKNGTITKSLTLEENAVLNWEGGNLNLSVEASLGRDAVLNLNGRSINNVTLTAFGAIVCNGTVTGNFTLADNVAYSWSQLGGYGLTLRGGVTLGDNTLLNLNEIKDTWTDSIALKGSATIGNGKLDGAFSVGEGKTLTLCGDFTGTGTITLNGSATLDLVTHRLVRDVTLNGNATITGGVIDGTVTVKSGKKLTLGGKLTGTGAVSLNGGAELALGNHVLAKAVTVGGSTTISGGTIDNCVSLQGSAILSLKNATLGDNSSFTLGNGSLLDLGGAQGAAWLNPSDDATATVENGCIGLTGGGDKDVKVYTLSFTQEGTISRIVGNGFRANLGENVSIATRNNVRFIESEVEQGDNQPPLNIDVTAQGKFALGKPPEEIGDSTPVINGNVKITYTGTGVQGSQNKDVDIYCTLIGSLTVVAKNGRVNAGGIGPRKPLDELSDNDLTSTGSVEAKQVYLTGFIGQSLTLKAANNGEDDAIQVTGNAKAAESLLFKAVEDNVYGNIVFNSALSARSITLEGKNIEGKAEAGYVEFENCDITATGAISIRQEFRGLAGQADSVLTAAAEGKVTLKVVGTAAAPIARASITSNANGVEMSSFTGAFLKLKASAAGAVTISESVVTTAGTSPSQTLDKYAVELEGGSIGIYSLSALNGNSFVHSTAGNITIGGALSALDTTKLDSAADITVSGDVLGGNLSATAGQSISLQNIGTLDNSVKDAVLTATNGTITATSFNGATLKASAKGAVTFNGNVAASGDDKRISSPTGTILVYSVELEGGSVGISGSLANNAGTALIKSTAGDISVGDALTARYAYMTSIGGNITLSGDIRTDLDCILNSAANITVSGDVLGGNLTATAAQSISLQAITIGAKAAILKAGSDNVLGNIMVSSFTGSVLMAHATGAVTINGCVTASASGINLEGASVSAGGSLTASKGNCFIKSNGGGISIGGNLSAMESSTLESAGNITLGTLNDKGEISDGGNVTGGDLRATATGSIELGAFTADDLRATAGGSIKVGNIGTAEQPAGTVTLTATNGGITAGNVNAGTLTATAGGSIKLGAFATGNLTATAGGSIELGAFTAGNLTATAGTSITLANIGTAKQPAGNVALEAQGDITATSSVNAGTLTVSAAGNVAMKDVTVGQEGASIVSTDGTDIAVNLETFTGTNAQIKTEKGAIQIGAVKGSNNTLQAASTLQVKTAVSGSGHTFLAVDSVTFSGSADLEAATIHAPKVTWENGATLSGLTLTGAKETDSAQVTVGGSLVLKDNSSVTGDVTIDVSNAKVTVDTSTVTGTVGGTSAIKLELNYGTIGGVGKLTSLTSSGDSGIAGLIGALMITSGLTLEGGELTLSAQTQSGSTTGQAMTNALTVTETSRLNADVSLAATISSLNLTLDAANTVNPLLTVNGQITSSSTSVRINLEGNESVEGGQKYALIAMSGEQPADFWTSAKRKQFSGLGATAKDFFWENGILYYQNGTELKTATWTPGENRLWNTVDQNWTQDGHRYRYKDGVDVVFNNTGEGGAVELEGELAPKDVLVEGTCDYTFKGTGKITGATALTKNGSGTLTIENANTYSGGTFIKAGTLVMADARALGTGTVTIEGGTLQLSHAGKTPEFSSVTLAGGTLKLSEGRKNFALTVTGTDNRMEGDWNNAFTGAVTLEAGSHLVSAGSMASWDGPREIVMKDGSTLEMDTHMDIWINDITNLTVEGEATMVNAFLRINPYTNGGVYTLDNGVENLKGEGVTAYCLDGSTFNLNGKATNLGIIVWNAQPNKDNTVMGGVVDTQVDIHKDSRLTLSDVVIGDKATFLMGDGAYLDMGGSFTKRVRLSAFSFTGASVTIDNGKLLVADGESVQLRTQLLGTATISLGKEANLDLNGYTLAGSKIELADDSATVSGGKFSGDVTVKSGKTLRLGVEQSIAGGVKLEKSTSTLSLGSDCSVEGAISGSGTIMKEGIGTSALSGSSLQSFTGSLEVQGGILNLLNAASVNVQDVTIQNGTLGVYSGESANEANEATLTIKGSKSLAAGPDAALNANLVMEGGSTLDVRNTNGAGLLMGSTVTLSTGMTLNDYSADWATWKDGTKYVLFTGVDGLDIGGGMMTGTLDYTQWVDAKEYFTNIEESNRYFLCYGGAPAQNAKGILTAVNDGSNVGMVYIMTMPEPTTSTLSLLALAALAARRRKD
ncbi:MAG: autotransporter-associated beta strand repeat-containing protein [Akkermansia sp.]|nr:autotransporter-associated beta strand repeat-containing protein [Akkermansia sp.]